MALTAAETRTADVRRADIIRASRRIFTERGYVRALTKEIAAEAGVSESMLFSFFESKEEIFEAAVFDPLDQLILEMLELSAIVPKADDRSSQKAYVRAHEQMMELQAEVVSLFGVAVFSDMRLGQRYFQQRLAPMFQRWMAETERSLEGWPLGELSPRLVLTFVFGSHFGLCLDAAMRGERLDVRERAAWVAGLTYSGIRPDRRRKRRP